MRELTTDRGAMATRAAARPSPAEPPALYRLLRAVHVAWTITTAVPVLVARLGWHLVTRPAGVRSADVVGSVAARTLERLGPAFIKVGQLLSTRADLLPRRVCVALGRLYDQVRSLPVAAAATALPGPVRAAVDHVHGLEVIAGGSISCVYRARLNTGEIVAIKLRRPGIDRVMALDLAILRRGARIAGRLPGLRGAPVTDIVEQLAASIHQQLDLEQEADSLRLLSANLAARAGVRIPAVYDGLSCPEALVLEYVPGLSRGGAAPLPSQPRRAAMVTALRAVYQMLFLDGFVHCDLHPGNLHPMPDGSVVIVDAGFARRLTERARMKFAQFFLHLHRGDGDRCADIVLSTASRSPDADVAGFRAGLVELIRQNSGVAVAEFDLVRFAVRLFALQRAHGLYADPQFVFPILSLIVLEGTAREVCPDVDFQAEAIPFVLLALQGRRG